MLSNSRGLRLTGETIWRMKLRVLIWIENLGRICSLLGGRSTLLLCRAGVVLHVCAVRRLARQIAQELGVVPETQRPLAASLMDQALNQTAGETAAAGAPEANRPASSVR